MQSPFRRFATAHEVAEHFGLGSAETVLRLGRDGRIPRIYITAKTIRFDMEEVEQALRASKAATAEVVGV